MSEAGDQPPPRAAPRVEDIERALVLAREVASATAGGGAANLRMEHLRALFTNGSGPAPTDRIQAALEAAGLAVDPPLAERPASVSLRVDKGRAALSDEPPPRPSGVAAYQAAAGTPKRGAAKNRSGVPLADAQRRAAADQADLRTPQSIAALLPALIVPVLAASFAGPLFGAIFAGLVLLTSALLSRPGALADGKLGPIRMPASLARSFLLVSFGVALGALAASIALIAAGGGSTSTDPNRPIEGQPQPQTTTPAQESRDAAARREAARRETAAREAAAERRARRERAARRRARRERAERAKERRQRAAERAAPSQSAPPSGGGAIP